MIAANIDQLQLSEAQSKNLLNGIIRKRIFAELMDDAFAAIGKIKNNWRI